MIYYANFSANNGTRLIEPITGTNKRNLEKRIRSLAEAERFSGNVAKWYVWYEDDSAYKRFYVAAGALFDGGCMRYDKETLKCL